MISIPIIAALAAALEIAHYKWLLERTQLDFRVLLSAQFMLLFMGASFLVPFFGHIDVRFFEFRNLFLFGFLLIVATLYNVFWIKALKRESLHEYEIIDLLLPIFTIALAALVFVDERDPIHLLLAAVAIGIFFLAHLHKWHISVKRVDRWLLLAVFLMAVEAILVKPLLEIVSPVALYAMRTGLIAVVLFVYWQPRLSDVPFFVWVQLAINAVFGISQMILTWIAIGSLGIVVTELALLIKPMLLLLISLYLFREKWKGRQVFAFAIILTCILLVYFI